MHQQKPHRLPPQQVLHIYYIRGVRYGLSGILDSNMLLARTSVSQAQLHNPQQHGLGTRGTHETQIYRGRGNGRFDNE